jgi:hypothetical protein
MGSKYRSTGCPFGLDLAPLIIAVPRDSRGRR